jgi:hypothetical protein
MDLTEKPPADWNARITSPLLSEGFAEAARGLGYRPWYAADADDAALVLVRSVPLAVVNRWTARAKIYVAHGHLHFLRKLLDALRRRGVAHVKLNDERHGLRHGVPKGWPGVIDVPRHVFLIDVAGRSDASLLQAMHDPVPRNIRKAERAKVVVEEIRTSADMDAFLGLMEETSTRMRGRNVAAVFPPGFFRRVFEYMVPTGQAFFLLARAGGVAIAGQMYLVGRDVLTYYHGASTRDRALTPKHGPTAIFWHAVRLARDRGLAVFDFGGANPTDDPNDVHFSVTDFKRRWGGRHVAVATADVVLSPLKVAVQDRILKPFWDRAHPLYLRLFRDAA